MLLVVTMLNPRFFQFERIIANLQQIPSVFGQTLIYLGFIIVLELIMRIFDTAFNVLGIEDVEETKEKIKREIE